MLNSVWCVQLRGLRPRPNGSSWAMWCNMPTEVQTGFQAGLVKLPSRHPARFNESADWSNCVGSLMWHSRVHSTLDEGTQLLFAERGSIALPVAVLSTEIPLLFLADALDSIVEDTVTKALNCGAEWVFPELNIHSSM